MCKKEECLTILKDFKEYIEEWDFDEDYYNSGIENREERISWAKDRIDKMIEIINNSELDITASNDFIIEYDGDSDMSELD